MATNFPNSPSNGDTHTFGGVTYTYNSTRGVWTASSGSSGGGGASVSTSDSAPSSPSDGDLWFDTADNSLFVYYQDTDSSQWIEIVSSAGSGSSGGGSSVTSYANLAAFPTTGNTEADMAWAEDTNAMYVWDGTEWDRFSTGSNELPEFTTEPASSYTLATDGTATTVTVAATDPEGFDITYSHDTSPSSQNQATITNSGGTFTITPTTTEANAGTFNLRFKASDGVHTSSKTSLVSLGFTNEWFGQYYGPEEFLPRDVAVDSNDFIYVVGSMRPNSGDDLVACISKLNKHGTLIWTKTLESTEADAGDTDFRRIRIDSNDNIYVLGYFEDTSQRIILVKYNTSGTVQFAKKYLQSASNTDVSYNGFAIKPDGTRIYISTRSYGGQLGGSYDTYYVNLISVDSNGTTQWVRSIGGASSVEYGGASLVANNSFVFVALRGQVQISGGGGAITCAGIGLVSASNGTGTNFIWANEATVGNLGSLPGPLYYDDDTSEVIQIYQPRSSTSFAATEYGVSILSRESNGATNSNSVRALGPNSSSIILRLNAWDNGIGVVKDNNYYYAPITVYDNNTRSTVGDSMYLYGFLDGDTSASSTGKGYLKCPSNSSGYGIVTASMAKTSEGRAIAVVRVGGDASSSGTSVDMGILSVNLGSTLPTSTTLGVNSNISLSTGSPESVAVSTTTTSVASDYYAGSRTNVAGPSYTLSNLTNTADVGPTITRDYEDLS